MLMRVILAKVATDAVGDKLQYIAGLLPDDDDEYTPEITELARKAARAASMIFAYRHGGKTMEIIRHELDSIIKSLEALDEVD